MGKVYLCGKVPKLKVPTPSIQASTVAVGSTVYLKEDGVPIPYLVVHQGNPSTLYDSSCNGTWLLRKDIRENRVWDSQNRNDYSVSDIHNYLSGEFLSVFDDATKNAIKQVKIPYRPGTSDTSTTVNSESNGVSTKVFLLSPIEMGVDFSSSSIGCPVDGAKLNYFSTKPAYNASNNQDMIAYLDGTASAWVTRSPYLDTGFTTYGVFEVIYTGQTSTIGVHNSRGIRPALILPNTALFDEETLLFKGVA